MKLLSRLAAVLLLCVGWGAQAQVTLNVVSAGDQNMVDYVTNYLGPKFEQMNPGVKVKAVGTGPGAAISRSISTASRLPSSTPH